MDKTVGAGFPRPEKGRGDRAPTIDLSSIKAVFFDAGGTLFKPYPSVGEIYAQVAGRHGLKAHAHELETLFHETWKARDGLASLSSHSGEKEERKWWYALVREVFSKIGKVTDFELFFEELYDLFARPEAWRLFPDVLPVMQELKKRGKVVGIVSNWDSRLFGICEGLGLSSHLDFILASAVVGAAKPHPRIFQEALRRAQVLPGEAVHVGDSLTDDVWGAEQAGIRGILIDRSGLRLSQAPTITQLQFFTE